MARRRPFVNRQIKLKDVSTAFLQSGSYGKGIYKYVSFKNPVTLKRQYYRQTGPIYGEASAPVRWESTIAPWLEEQGFEPGLNERSIFYHPERDLVLLLYVDDCLADGEEEDIDWLFNLLANRFDCKDTEELIIDSPLDYLGIEVSMDQEHLYLSMANYIEKAIKSMKLEVPTREISTPIHQPIDTESEPLDAKQK